MFRKSSLILLAALFCIPFLAHAEESTVLDFSSSRERQEWNMRKLTHVSAASEGVRIQTTTQGTLLRPIALPHSTDVIEILYTSPRGGSFSLLWQRPGGGDAYSQLPFTLAPAAEPRPLIIMPSMTGNWTAHPGAIGFSFPEGTDITLRTITLYGWGPWEKLIENVQCFWTFDIIAPHTINYLWGPLLCSTPVARKALYDHAPPIAHSGMRFIYALLGLGLAVLGWHAWRSGLPRKHVLLRALLLVCLLWAALDIRMGTEFLRNWMIDVHLYVRESAGTRVFRSLAFFPDFAEAVRPVVQDQPKYVFLSSPTYPERTIRYFTWPSQPVSPASGSGALHWLVYDRKDLTLDADGRIVENGVPVSPSGSVIHEFIEGTFIFRVQQ